MTRTLALALLLLCLLAGAGRAATPPLNLEVEVYQALRAGTRGSAFAGEAARIGIPLPQGTVRSVNGRPALAVEGKEYQGRVLKSWPDGSVKWALLEFLASPGKEKSEHVRVTAGPGASSGRPLAREAGGRVVVDTGVLRAELSGSGFNVFDRVSVGGQEIVKPGDSRGIVLTDGAGKEFLASHCPDTRISIEENGPVRAVLRVDGGHYLGKQKLLDYTMRLFFSKGKQTVKAQYTLRNASKESPRHCYIKSLRLETALSLGEGRKARVSSASGSESFGLGKGRVLFYQAVSDFPWTGNGDSFYYHGPVAPDMKREYASKRGYSQEGYWIWQDGKLSVEGGRNQFPELGYLDLSDRDGRGLTAGIRYMAGNWPKALSADNAGALSVALWPEESKQGYWIRYGSHTTFEVMYAFHGDGESRPQDEMNRFQYPLAARAPVDWYNRNVEGIYPLYHFISFSEEKRLAEKLGTEDHVAKRKPKFEVWRYHYWGEGSFLNQHDFARIALVNALREDRDLLKAGEYQLTAESMINYYADWSVYHSDDYDYSKLQFDVVENKKAADLAKVVFEWEHQHWYGMPLYYYLTGDERVRDAILDWGDYIKKLASPLSLNQMRVFGTGMFSLAALYEFTGDGEYLRLADLNFERLLKVPDNQANPYASIFINWERGYIAGGSGSGWKDTDPKVKADLMMGSLLYDGLLNYYQYRVNDGVLKPKLESLLHKMSEFMYKEPYFEGVKRGHWAYWIPYEYCLTDREKSRHSYKLIGQASFWTVFPYEQSGDKRWSDRMALMLKMALWDGDGVWGSYGYIDHPGFQTMGYYLTKNAGGEHRE